MDKCWSLQTEAHISLDSFQNRELYSEISPKQGQNASEEVYCDFQTIRWYFFLSSSPPPPTSPLCLAVRCLFVTKTCHDAVCMLFQTLGVNCVVQDYKAKHVSDNATFQEVLTTNGIIHLCLQSHKSNPTGENWISRILHMLQRWWLEVKCFLHCSSVVNSAKDLCSVLCPYVLVIATNASDADFESQACKSLLCRLYVF